MLSAWAAAVQGLTDLKKSAHASPGLAHLSMPPKSCAGVKAMKSAVWAMAESWCWVKAGNHKAASHRSGSSGPCLCSAGTRGVEEALQALWHGPKISPLIHYLLSSPNICGKGSPTPPTVLSWSRALAWGGGWWAVPRWDGAGHILTALKRPGQE